MTREEVKRFLRENLLTSIQAAETLGISRQLLANYVKNGRIQPILVTTQGRLFLRTDLEQFDGAKISNALTPVLFRMSMQYPKQLEELRYDDKFQEEVFEKVIEIMQKHTPLDSSGK